MKRQPRRISVQIKLNALVISGILLVALGLMGISYYTFCRRVDERYEVSLKKAADACANNVDADELRYFWNAVNTEEFRSVHDRAEAEKNEQLIEDWLKSKPGWYYDNPEVTDANRKENGEPLSPEEFAAIWSLWADYEQIQYSLQGIVDYLEADTAYYQYSDGLTTYNIADTDEGLLYIGTVEAPIPEFSAYPGNVAIPPIVYHSDFGWLMTAMVPVINHETKEVVGAAGVDIDMTEVVAERSSFLRQSLLLVVILLLVAIVVGMIVLRKTVVHPLKKLSSAATGFAAENRAVTKEDVISLDIRNNDEIGDLYREIRSMEGRIVDYTENLTRVTAEKERVNTELRTAAQIQEAMLPNSFPAFPDRTDFDLYASMTPAKEVGGDFYDFFLIDLRHLALVIADVSDKGIPAALFMMASKILINYRSQLGGSPSEILSAVNAEICTGNKSKMFVTVWLGILDLETGLMTCSNAGHEYPVIRGSDGVFRILKDKHGLVVGARPKSVYRDYEIQMNPGDAVFVYTDGIPEASNAKEEFYGLQRLEDALNRLPCQDPCGILEGIKADVDAFTGDASQFDDMTMLCLVYKGQEAPEDGQ